MKIKLTPATLPRKCKVTKYTNDSVEPQQLKISSFNNTSRRHIYMLCTAA